MDYRRSFIFCIILIISATPLFIFSDDSAGSGIWKKAVDISRKNKDWVPGSFYIKNILSDLNGKVKNNSEFRLESHLTTNGATNTELIKYIENGEDVTEKKKQEFNNKNSKGFSLSLYELNPFDPDGQENVSFTNTGVSEIKYDKKCLIFNYSRKMPGGEKQTGSAWLEEENGIPVEVKLTINPLPKYVINMTNTITYETGNPGGWFPVKLTVEGIGGFLFIKLRIRNSTVLSNYWRK